MLKDDCGVQVQTTLEHTGYEHTGYLPSFAQISKIKRTNKITQFLESQARLTYG